YCCRVPTFRPHHGPALPAGALLPFRTGVFEVGPTITYRSNLGAFDPAVVGNFAFGRHTNVNVFVGRTTLTNDGWIWSDLVNSAAVLGLGLDTRNYYRADRGEATLHRLVEGVSLTV